MLDHSLPLVYPELRRVSARQLRKERTNHTLQRTALVHEVFGDLTIEEAAHVSGSTVTRDWRTAKVWLSREFRLHGPAKAGHYVLQPANVGHSVPQVES